MFDYHYYLIVSICVLLFSISKSGFSGGGLALIAVTVLSINFGPLKAISILLPLLLVCDLMAGYLNRKYIDKKVILGLVPFTLLGVILGTLLFKIIDLNMISIFIGSISLAYVFFNYLITKSILNSVPFNGSKSFWGTLSGFTSFCLHSGGLPMQTYLLSQYRKKTEFVATLVFSMAIINVSKIVPYFYLEILSLKQILEYMLFSPIAIGGVLLGNWMNKKVSDKSFFLIINIFIVVASMRLIYDGFNAL